jgi:acyl-CoA thioester hydrolase
MYTDQIVITPKYNEVDQMGYVYHGNYVSYCHQARTELMRKLTLCDATLERKGIMLPVISFNIDYKIPIGYDEPIVIQTSVKELPNVRLNFEFEIFNLEEKLTSKAKSTVVFVDAKSRKPLVAPSWIIGAFENQLKPIEACF